MYFDYAATTPPDQDVLETFAAVNRDFWANPNSLYRPGLRAESLLEQSRLQVLTLLGASGDYRCVFTSGATESNNASIVGAARRYVNRGKHIVTSAVEHPSVLEVCRFLEQEGWSLTVLPVNEGGSVDIEELQNALRPDTALVSLMHVNNEIGSVNDIGRLGAMIKEKSNAVFHVDAAQSVGKFPLSLDGGPVDLLTFSAHKFFGLKGSGALLMKKRMIIDPLLRGGGQEFGYRSGTADPARAAALAKALRLAVESQEETFANVRAFKQQVVDAVSAIDGIQINGADEGASPYIFNCSVSGIRPETLLQGLAEKEIYISTVSACSAGKTNESTVVRALAGNQDRARTSIRISLASCTEKEEVDTLCNTLGPLIESLRVG